MTEAGVDRFDRALLAEVRRNNLTPARVLADRVGLSESAVLRRLRRLRQAGIIAADVAIVRPDVLGQALTVIVLVNLVREGRPEIEDFSRRLSQRPEVADIWYVTGDTDFVMVVKVADMAEYGAFTEAVLLGDANVGGFTTMVSMRDFAGRAAQR